MMRLTLRSRAREEMIDVTEQLRPLAAKVGDGVLFLHCPHTTAALTVQENSDPDLRVDYLDHLRKLVPQPGFRHSEGNADAHIKASLVGSTQPVIVEGGELQLGRWQAVYFVELDGPRQREIWVQS